MASEITPAAYGVLATVPIVGARLPAVYQAARDALQECSRIDECKDWADKAEALASYARQSQDDTLRKLCDRIQARAIRRAGELLTTLDGSGTRTDLQPHDGTVTRLRTTAAKEAGLSERQRVTAVRVANVPEPEFERLVESDEPPTVTQLADIGRRERIDYLTRKKPQGFQEATRAMGTLREFARFCNATDAALVANGIEPDEVERVRGHVAIVDAWLDRLVVNLREEEC